MSRCLLFITFLALFLSACASPPPPTGATAFSSDRTGNPEVHIINGAVAEVSGYEPGRTLCWGPISGELPRC